MNIKRKTCDIRSWKKNIYFSTYPPPKRYTYPITLPVLRNPQHRSLLTVVSATSAPPFVPLRHRRNVCHRVMDRFTRQTLPTANKKHFFMNILWIESFCPQKTHIRMLLYGSILLKHGRHFDYWNQPLNMCLRFCCLECHEAGLCCYLVIYIENLLRPLQLFYFHLWPIYWLSLVLYLESLWWDIITRNRAYIILSDFTSTPVFLPAAKAISVTWYINNAHAQMHLPAATVKWLLQRCFRELVATYVERTLHDILCTQRLIYFHPIN
jgi:hypothetical protein